jgi:hypothetical protein
MVNIAPLFIDMRELFDKPPCDFSHRKLWGQCLCP